jgi:hypothetical protein
VGEGVERLRALLCLFCPLVTYYALGIRFRQDEPERVQPRRKLARFGGMTPSERRTDALRLLAHIDQQIAECECLICVGYWRVAGIPFVHRN